MVSDKPETLDLLFADPEDVFLVISVRVKQAMVFKGNQAPARLIQANTPTEAMVAHQRYWLTKKATFVDSAQSSPVGLKRE